MSKVISVREVEPRRVYAIETTTGTFISDGLAHHNCVKCNGFLNGNYIMYGLYMQKKYPEEYKQLTNLFMEHKKGTAPKLKPLDIKELYNEWLREGRELEKKIGEPIFPKSWDYVTI